MTTDEATAGALTSIGASFTGIHKAGLEAGLEAGFDVAEGLLLAGEQMNVEAVKWQAGIAVEDTIHDLGDADRVKQALNDYFASAEGLATLNSFTAA